MTISLPQDIFQTNPGFLWLATIDQNGKILHYAGENPRPIGEIDDFIIKNEHLNQYFCVNLTQTPKARLEADVSLSNLIYADLDDKCHPSDLLVRPTWVVQTSPYKYQAFWLMDEPVDADITSNISRRIAAYHGLDACWDKVRLMRLPGSYNYKYEQFRYLVKIVDYYQSRYRLQDFIRYPEIQFKYITDDSVDIEHVPKYAELDTVEQMRIDNYMMHAVMEELLKLTIIEKLEIGERYQYHTIRGIQEFGWERGCMWIARCLVELANAPWNNYSLAEAYQDFMSTAPTDIDWTINDLHKKWQSALNANCGNTIKFRKYPKNWVVQWN